MEASSTEGGFMLFGVFISYNQQQQQPQATTTTLSDNYFKLFGVVIEKPRKMMIGKPQKIIIRLKLPQLPLEFRDMIASMGADDLKLILSRKLTATDMNPHHNRLSMPQGQIIYSNFLTPVEEELIQSKRVAGKANRCSRIEVKVVGTWSKKEHTMTLARWNDVVNKEEEDHDDEDEQKKMKKKKKKQSNSWWYALAQNWMEVAHENGFKEGDLVQVWSFRYKLDGRLGFVLHKLDRPPTVNTIAAAPPRRDRESPSSSDDDHTSKKRKILEEGK